MYAEGRTTGNRVYGEPYRGFESLSLRQQKKHPIWVLLLLHELEGIRKAGVSKGHSAAFAPAMTERVECATESLSVSFLYSPISPAARNP